MAGLLVFLLLAVHGTGSPAAATGGPSAAAGCPGAPSSTVTGWFRHSDAANGFRIDYPDSWHVYQPQSAAVQFLGGPDESDFVEVRVITGLPVNFDKATPQGTQQLADQLLAGQQIQVVRRDQVTIDGAPGWQYIYSFTDPKLGAGVHVHVFLFQGTTIRTVVLQALPECRLRPLAAVFDQILARFKVLPLPAAGASPSPGGSPGAGAAPSPSPTP